MTAITALRTVCLDTAILGNVSRDRNSKDGACRVQASAFLKALMVESTVPLVTWHHLEELLAHENLEVARCRFEFLRGLPAVAWIASRSNDGMPGSIVDILIHEVRSAYENPLASSVEVRNRAADKLWRFGTGAEMLEAIDEGRWELLRPLFQEHQRDARRVVAISRSRHIDISNETADSFINGIVRGRADATAAFAALARSLEADIRARGDKRIENPTAAAADFMGEVASESFRTIYSTTDGMWHLLKSWEIFPSDIGTQTTMGDLMQLGTFRKRLRLANKRLGFDWTSLKERVTTERVPTSLLAESIRRYGHDTPQRKGSDLNDVHLATLCFYADFSFVDKRTYENLSRARTKVSTLASLIKHFDKGGLYPTIPAKIRQGAMPL